MPRFGQRACTFGMAMVKTIEDHYANFLGPVYTWMIGDRDTVPGGMIRIAATMPGSPTAEADASK
jgi:hypothetical protein